MKKNMKKAIILATAGVMTLGMTGCGQKVDPNPRNNPRVVAIIQEEQEKEREVLQDKLDLKVKSLLSTIEENIEKLEEAEDLEISEKLSMMTEINKDIESARTAIDMQFEVDVESSKDNEETLDELAERMLGDSKDVEKVNKDDVKKGSDLVDEENDEDEKDVEETNKLQKDIEDKDVEHKDSKKNK